jgi:hypothetical protein
MEKYKIQRTNKLQITNNNYRVKNQWTVGIVEDRKPGKEEKRGQPD